jgi:hypothetical protein
MLHATLLRQPLIVLLQPQRKQRLVASLWERQVFWRCARLRNTVIYYSASNLKRFRHAAVRLAGLSQKLDDLCVWFVLILAV